MKKKTIDNISLKVLYLEDLPRDIEIIRKLLIDAGFDLSMDCTEGKKEFVSLLHRNTYDVILSDFKLPGFDAFGALKFAKDICPEVPFICVSGSIGEETAIELMKQGAVDYILKDRLARLPLAVKRALDELKEKRSRQMAEAALRASEERMRAIVEGTPLLFFYTQDLDANTTYVSPTVEQITGYKADIWIKRKDWFITAAEFNQGAKEKTQAHLRGEFTKEHVLLEVCHANGSRILLEAYEYPIMQKGKIVGLQGVAHDITERRQAEEALIESQTLYYSFIEQLPNAVFRKDREGHYVLVNSQFCKLKGLKKEDFIGRKPTEVAASEVAVQGEQIHATKYANLGEDAHELIMRTGKILQSEEEYPVMSGGMQFMHVVRMPVFDYQGTIIGTQGIMFDITERKQAEDALRKNEVKLKELFETAPVGYHEIDELGNISAVNQTELKMLGFTTNEEMIGLPVWGFVLDSEESRKRVLGELAGNRPPDKNTERFIVRRDGTSFPALIDEVILRNEHGKIKGIRTTLLDITDRKRAEEALHESEAKYRTLVTQSPDGIFIVDLSGTFLSVNKAMCDNLKYSEEEFLSMKMWDIVPQQYLSLHKNRLAAVIKGESKKETAEYEVKGKDGIVHFIEVLSTPYYQDKDIIGFQGIARDTTERRRIEEQIRQMQKLEELGTLAGGIAHDFNNILGIILAYNENIKQFKDDTKQLDLATETITKAVDRGKTLVQSILTFARKTETAFGPVNVNDVVMEIMAMILETFPKILTYSQNFDKSIPYINADHSQLHQALLNLCVNARDAMPKAGILTINTRMVSVASLHNQHPDAAASSYVCIEVSDTGEGMSEEIRKRIFEPFFTTKGIGKGTGLGLSVVFGVIQSHKGFIDVDSQLGKGTTFRLYLPASQVAEPITEKEKETSESIPGGTETLMMSLRMVLVEKGYKVISAGDGQTALKIYQERKDDIALVLTDLGLPNISGFEVCQQIKAINPNEHIILASGYIDPEMKAEFLNAGIQHFLYKPYNLTKVMKEVREVLDKK